MRLELYGQNVRLSEAARARVERRLAFALGRLEGRISRVQVTLADLNGPRGGIDKRCLMVADLGRAGPVVVEHRAAEWGGVIAGAAGRLGRAVRCRLASRRRRRRGTGGQRRLGDRTRPLREEV
jgi:hypothetical protein